MTGLVQDPDVLKKVKGLFEKGASTAYSSFKGSNNLGYSGQFDVKDFIVDTDERIAEELSQYSNMISDATSQIDPAPLTEIYGNAVNNTRSVYSLFDNMPEARRTSDSIEGAINESFDLHEYSFESIAGRVYGIEL
ncbi:MAG: hypothetical protein GOV01_00040 [Candidatus Altiarchaeota archaeon]|nr:hypothetical protein [Candidatus Altiarchaeota archaeon]